MIQKREVMKMGAEDRTISPGGLRPGDDAAGTVCFTGHRRIPAKDAAALPGLLDEVIRELYGRGARNFRAGGAMGFDTVAALKVLSLREELPGLRLELILPCRDQTAGWNEVSRRTYDYILHAADSVRFLFDTYIDGCMLERDRRLVAGSRYCVAYCTSSRGGTAYTVTQAIRGGLELINLAERIR